MQLLNWYRYGVLGVFISFVFLANDRLPYVDFDVSMRYVKHYNNFSHKNLDRARSHEFMYFLRSLYKKNNLRRLTSQKKPLIPKKIHQIWVGKNEPPAIFKWCQASIKKYHPDWEYKLWRDEDIERLHLVNRKFYDSAQNYGERSDIARYEILYQLGGVYLDVDFESIRALDILHYTYDFYAGMVPLSCQSFIANGVIGSRPGHPILKYCIDTIHQSWRSSDTLKRTGPFHFQEAFWHVGKYYSGPIIAFPASYFFPLTHEEALRNPTRRFIDRAIQPETFAIHHWTGSWQAPVQRVY